MKNILYQMLTFILMFFATSIFGQDQLDNYYYYEGEKIFLDLNTRTISISFEGQNSINSFTSLRSNSIEVSKIIEDYSRTIVNSIDNKANNRKSLKAYYMEVSAVKDLSLIEYRKRIEFYKRKSNTLTVSPTYKTKEGKEFGLSNNFYVKLKDQKDVKILYQKAKEMNVEVLGHDKYMPLWFTLSVVSPQKLNALNLANIFYETGLFESTEPAFMYHDLQNSNDSYFNDQWTLKNTGQSNGVAGTDISIEQAWSIATGTNIKVAVIDQGIQLNHPDLQANIYGTGFDAQTNTTPSQVRGAHGTACAGIIGAVKDNNIGIAGVAPSSDLMSISVGFSGTSIQMLANGVNWAWQNGADIISNSWGGGTPSGLFNNAVTNALTNGRNGLGSIIVFSSGNDNVNGAQYPSNSNPLILCVGAIDRCGVRSGRIDIIPQSCDPWCSGCRPGSSYGTPLDVVAGGTSIPTTDRQGNVAGNGDYNPSSSSPSGNYSNYDYHRWFGGTSAACPYVAGVAALVLSVNPNLTVQEVNDIIEKSAKKIRTDLYNYSNIGVRPNGSWNNQLGYGLVNAYQAVLLAQDGNCPENITINQNVSAGQTDIQKAKNLITATNTVYSGGTAVYSANGIRLHSGFSAKLGSTFRAYIEDCSQNRRIHSKQKNDDVIITYQNMKVDNNVEEQHNALKAYPNPTKDILTINSTEQIIKWELKNHFGNLIAVSRPGRGAFKDDQIRTKDLTTGFYILMITLSNGQIIHKNILKD